MTGDWLSTGEAAEMMGYCRDRFRDKFKDLIPNRRINRGNYQWLKSAVEKMAKVVDSNTSQDGN